MSYQAMRMAKMHRIGNPTWKAVLFAIAEHCHADGSGCSALYSTLVEESEAARSTVIRAVHAMVSAGVLTRSGRTLSIEMGQAIDMTQGVRETPLEVSERHFQGVTETPLESVRETPRGVRETLESVRETPRTEPSTTVNKKSHRAPETSVPENFEITENLRTWAVLHAPALDLQTETVSFLEHHRSKDTRFRDWNAAWRKWMNNAVRWSKPKPATNGHRQPITYDRTEPTGSLAL